MKITKYKIRQIKYPKVLTDSQFEKIIDYYSESGRDIAESYQIALYIGYYTGMRKGEILALNKDDVDLVGRTITINKQVIRGEHKDDTMLQLSPKTDASMSKIPIVPQLCDILTDWFKGDPYEIVIPDKEGNYINPDNVTVFCSNMSRRLGFHFNFHMLRHTFTTNLIDNGAAPKVVQTLDRQTCQYFYDVELL